MQSPFTGTLVIMGPLGVSMLLSRSVEIRLELSQSSIQPFIHTWGLQVPGNVGQNYYPLKTSQEPASRVGLSGINCGPGSNFFKFVHDLYVVKEVLEEFGVSAQAVLCMRSLMLGTPSLQFTLQMKPTKCSQEEFGQ